VREFGFPNVLIATGARWRRDGVGRQHHRLVPGSDGSNVFAPEDIFDGAEIAGPVLVFDDDHFYMGGVIAEALRARGLDVTLVTPGAEVSRFAEASLEQPYIQRQILEKGIDIVTQQTIARIDANGATIACVFTGRERRIEAASVVLVTARLPEDALYRELAADREALAAAGIRSLRCIGDCLNPGTIAAAIHAGHRYAREFGLDGPGDLPFRIEHIAHADALA